MNKSRSKNKVHLYLILAAGVCLVSLMHVPVLVGHGRYLKQASLVSPICTERKNASRRRTTTILDSYMAPKALRFERTRAPPRVNPQNFSHAWGIYQLVLNDGMALLRSAEPTIVKEKLSKPQTIFLNYMRHHSADSLRQDKPEEFRKRKFAIAYYSCPHQLGNRLFHFMNNVFWAVITGRTVLYKYMDMQTCEQLKIFQPMLYLDDAICQAANSVQDCDAVLERAPWLPSYDEFSDPSWEIHRVDFWQTHLFRVTAPWIRSRYPFDESIHTNLTKVDMIESKLVEFSALTNVEMTNLEIRFIRQLLLETNEGRIRARKLTIKGLKFIYGMFFAEMFRLQDEEVEIVKDYYPKANESNIFSIALHSRHKQAQQTGSYIQNEKDCLNRVLTNRTANQPCQVCAMSDRPLALETLKTWLEQEHQCHLIQVRHSVETNSFSIEHGPNAGAAFARELDVCHRYGSHAVVTTLGASSSALLEVLAHYHNNKNYGGESPAKVETQFCNRLAE